MSEPSARIGDRYWSPCRLILSVDGEFGRRIVVTEKPFARIGSDPMLEVVLPPDRMPPLAAYVHVTQAGVHLRRFSGPPAAKWLANDKLRFGECTIRVSTNSGEAPLPSIPHLETRWREGLMAPVVWLTHRRNDNPPVAYQLKRRLTLVGRQKLCHLKLDDGSISRYHCALYWENNQLWVIDLLSRNGVKIQGRHVAAAQVEPGSTILVGNISMAVDTGVTPPIFPESAAAANSDTVFAPLLAENTKPPDDVVDELAEFLARAQQEDLTSPAAQLPFRQTQPSQREAGSDSLANPETGFRNLHPIIIDTGATSAPAPAKHDASPDDPFETVTDHLTQQHLHEQRRGRLLLAGGLLVVLAAVTTGIAAWSEHLRFLFGL